MNIVKAHLTPVKREARKSTHRSYPVSFVFVVDTNKEPLNPVHPGRARPVECGSGGMTKYNRQLRNLPKTHWLDAACVGKVTPLVLRVNQVTPLRVVAHGHGCRQMCLMDKFGFPRSKPKAKHFPHAFRTGDIVKACVPLPLKNAGMHTGRMSAKAKGGFSISTNTGTITDIGKQYCQLLQRADGYGYTQKGETAFPPVP